mgnify:FL=1
MGIRLTATFLDEISDDIPHQNWGVEEWDRDFAAMKETGIDTVVMIRCGARKFIAYPSKILMEEEGCHEPPVDLVDMFLTLAEKYGMRYFFGTYTRRKNGENTAEEIERSWDQERRLIDEAWERYGHRKAFAGWYLAKEILYREPAVIAEFRRYGEHCKKISGNLPILISPAMWGRKAWDPNDPNARDLNFRAHEQMWDEIMSEIAGLVDIIAFQDGHVTYEELPEALRINKRLADKYGIELWTNTESFDRDMPIRFLPIKWEKMRLKLLAAEQAGIEHAMTFEFSHFMSPNSCYLAAGNLRRRYLEWLDSRNTK